MTQSSPIKIVYYSETVDNWGRQKASFNPEVIFRVLSNPDNFSDDMSFTSDCGRVYFVDDLQGKTVEIEGYTSFIIEFED